MRTATFTAAWPRIAYWALWVSTFAVLIAGITLLALGQTVEWVPTTGDPNVYQAQAVSLVPAGSTLTGIGAVAVIVNLMLEAFVGPLHRRKSQN